MQQNNFRAINYTLEANNQGDDLNLTLKEHNKIIFKIWVAL
jgi:hypothetical protein